MAKFFRLQLRIGLDQVRRLKRLEDRTSVDRTSHIRIAIARYLEEEEMRLIELKKRIEAEDPGKN
jgi:predicted transcriptional regulator